MEQVIEQPNRVHWRPIVDGLVIPDQPRTLLERARSTTCPPSSVATGTRAGAVHHAQLSGWRQRRRSMKRGWRRSSAMTPPTCWRCTRRQPTPRRWRQWRAWLATVSSRAKPGGWRGSFRARAQAHVYDYSYEHEIDDLSVDHVIHGIESNILFGNNYAAAVANHALTPTTCLFGR